MKKFLKITLDFYIKSSIHVAFSVLALAKISLLTAGLNSNTKLLIFIFFSALSAYNFIKFFPLLFIPNFINKNHLIISITIIAVLINLVIVFLISHLVLVFAIIGGLLVLTYSIPLKSGSLNYRSKKGWKLYLVVLSWLCLTVAVPLASADNFNFVLFFKLIILQGIYIFVAILPFEIGDLNSDQSNLQTLPQRFGIFKVKQIGLILLALGILFASINFYNFFSLALSVLVTFLILGIMLWRSNENQSPYYARFWVEGIPILWYLMTYYF